MSKLGDRKVCGGCKQIINLDNETDIYYDSISHNNYFHYECLKGTVEQMLLDKLDSRVILQKGVGNIKKDLEDKGVIKKLIEENFTLYSPKKK
jgi:hypothetical protein